MAPMATPETTTILHRCRIAPPPGTALQSLPLTFFDMVWLHFNPIQRLLFYEYPCSTTHFLETLIPNFKKSLSQTLKHFLPLAGNLIYPLNSGTQPQFLYLPGDSVSVTIAESIRASEYFNYLTGNKPRNADDFYAFVPDLPQPKIEHKSSCKIIPVFAIQITLFPETDICVGFTNHHAVGDASSIVGFIKAWSSIATLGKDDELLATEKSLPFYDRSVVKDQLGVGNTFWTQMDVFRVESLPLKFPINKVRSTYILRKNDIQKLKNLIQAKKLNLTYLSSFTITTAYIWTCLIKSATAAGEDVNDTEPEHFVFAVDARRRLDSPVPATYFGNCVAFGATKDMHGKLKGDEGLFVAAELIGEVIVKKVNNKDEILRDAENWMSKLGCLIPKRCFGVAGSPRFDMYDTDFGWGKPVKYEAVSIDGAGSMSLCKSREFEGGLEIGLSLPKKKMDAFADIFYAGLNM
ncbi:hypothetical protein BUALT_Bualt01G0213700 [Buddleja alternifolia]|uniref:Uncharacterized protein n=1 Tax=Buddleja alternifolia TaxID=168488 RepID=A0AAV6YEU1_9LAMI|nr:hypothetical protein BUALT_Bualt01G0213700 [Buddleja alternifolia]